MEALLEHEQVETQPMMKVTKGAQTSGILILNGDGGVLYVNQMGWDLLRQLHATQQQKDRGLLPSVITDLCRELDRRLDGRRPDEDQPQIELCCVMSGAHKTLVLRALPLHEGGSREVKTGRTLIILESVNARDGELIRKKEEFRLTERESEVVDGLLRGWTNKEIANHLGISEPTVKAHISHIMQKTRCTTRTAIVGQLLAV